ncbi:MAG TPA: hypothetical protein VNS58_26470 [Puia sp.]|jgi:hypothetical protein|nr:hypothetical protein [Puia sp.]
MIFPYLVILKRDSERTLDLISILLCVFSGLNFINEQLRSGHFQLFFTLFAAAVLAGTAINIVINRKTGQQVRYRYWLLLAGLGWLGMSFLPWLGILFFFQSFLEHQVKRPLEIGFSSDRVVINTLFKRSYAWTDFNNVVLKDGLLTLDFKNNRLIQKEILDSADEDDADEDEFNAYCQARLQEADRVKMHA